MRCTILSLVLLLGPCALVQGQPIGTDREIELTRDALRVRRQSMVALAMNLSEQEATAFWPLYLEMRAEAQALGDRRVALIRKIEGSDSASESEVKAATDDWLRLEQDLLKLRTKYVKRFRKIVSQRSVARLFQLEAKLDAVTNYDLVERVPLVE
jgi:hypothetical protein